MVDRDVGIVRSGHRLYSRVQPRISHVRFGPKGIHIGTKKDKSGLGDLLIELKD